MYRAEHPDWQFQPSLSPSVWKTELVGDHDYKLLMDGIQNGFKIIDPPNLPVKTNMKNYKSALHNAELVESEISDELREGRYMMTHEKPQIISALGCVPKSDGNIRLIHDAAHPSGSALNDFSTTMPKQRFQTVGDALHLMSPGCYFAKVDLKSAYRRIAIHPSNYPYMGLKWTFKDSGTPSYMVDKRLCFGAHNSPGIFHRLTQVVR